MKLREWQMAEQGPAEKKATKKTLVHGVATKKRLVHGDAIILKTIFSCNNTRMEIQARLRLADCSEKTICIVGLMCNRLTKVAEIGRAIIATCNESGGVTEAMCVQMRDELMAE